MTARHFIYVMSLFGFLASGGVAAEIQSLESIRETARGFLAEQTAGSGAEDIRITIGHVDSRLRLQQCERPLEAFLPRGGRLVGNVTVGVRCAGAKPWSLYVQGKVQTMAEVVVTRRSLSRGTFLTETDVVLERRDLSRLTSGYLTDLNRVIGKKLSRSVRSGLAINETMVRAPAAVRRGERVTILARTGGLEVRMEGEALSAGAPGDVIPVRNISSDRQVEAEVIAPGVVKVRM